VGAAPEASTRPPAAATTADPGNTLNAKTETQRFGPKGCGGQQILDNCDAGQGGARNCFDLADAFANGIGVEENFPLSMEMFKKACNLGHKGVCKRAYGE